MLKLVKKEIFYIREYIIYYKKVKKQQKESKRINGRNITKKFKTNSNLKIEKELKDLL